MLNSLKDGQLLFFSGSFHSCALHCFFFFTVIKFFTFIGYDEADKVLHWKLSFKLNVKVFSTETCLCKGEGS